VNRALQALVALLALITVELVRSSGPLLDMAFAEGVVAAAGSALVTYAAPGLFVLALMAARRIGPDAPLLVGALLLGGARLVVQALDGGARFGVGLATVALGIAVLTLAVGALARRAGGNAAAAALATGIAAAIGLQLALGTWDAYWRHDAVGWLVTSVVVAGLGLAAWASRDPVPHPETTVRRLWVLGPVVGLAVMTSANPAFAASQSGVPLAVAGPVIGVAWLMAAWVTARLSSTPPIWARLGAWADALTLAALVAALMLTTDVLALLFLFVLPVVTVGVLARAVLPMERPVRIGRTAGTATLVGLGVILPLLVYQLDYDIPLGYPNWLVLVSTGVVIALASVRRGASTESSPDRDAAQSTPRRATPLLAGAVVVVLAGTGIAVAAALDRPGVSPEPAELTLVSWNLHYGVDPAGDVDLEQIARTIAEQDPDVVALQELSRGWVMGGGADMATWLANRLGMHMSFAPAADRQFGNAILTRSPHDDVAVLALPYGAGPQNRSAISADVQVAGGPVRVTSIHLQHRESNTPTRLDQLTALLAAEPGSPSIVAGDFNAEPGWPEIELLTRTFTSAQDAAGDPAALTSPSIDPAYRIDWVFGRGVTFSRGDVLADALASDHLPLVVTFRVTGG
jgi:endonuclease/exonuclease/phosphatase family metal-dependent hydrolase